MLGDLLVSGEISFLDCLDKVEIGLQSLADKVHNLSWHSGREQKCLAIDLSSVGQQSSDALNIS